jgi:hypothetical protein
LRRYGRGETEPSRYIRFSEDGKKVFERALASSRRRDRVGDDDDQHPLSG